MNRSALAYARPARIDALIGRLAVGALYHELAAYPKPGLVSFVDSGSHKDMDARTFLRSIFALRRYFPAIARAGVAGSAFSRLARLGILAEERMQRATGGPNTHRGAIFTLGLLAAAGARWLSTDRGNVDSLGDTVRTHWGQAIRNMMPTCSHGAVASHRYRVGGVRAEAADGFPHIFNLGLPIFRRELAEHGDLNRASVYCLFTIMASLDDTNLLYRGGLEGLQYAQAQARQFLASRQNDSAWHERAKSIHEDFMRRGLSAGGSADLLAATLFLSALERRFVG